MNEHGGECGSHVLPTWIVGCLPDLTTRLDGRLLQQCVRWFAALMARHRPAERLDHERARDLARLVPAHAVGDRQQHTAASNLEAGAALLFEQTASRQIRNDESVLVGAADQTDIRLSAHRQVHGHPSSWSKSRTTARRAAVGAEWPDTYSVGDLQRQNSNAIWGCRGRTPTGGSTPRVHRMP